MTIKRKNLLFALLALLIIALGIGASLIFLLPKPVKLSISAEDIFLNVGETKTIKYDINKKATVTFDISDDKVAKVSNFSIVGEQSGETTLKIIAFVGKESCICVCNVSVSSEENKQPDVEQEKPNVDPSEPKIEDENSSDGQKDVDKQPVDPPKQDPPEDDQTNDSKQDQNYDNNNSDSNTGDNNQGQSGDDENLDSDKNTDSDGDNNGQSGEEKQDKDENATPDPPQDDQTKPPVDKDKADSKDDNPSLEEPKDEPSDDEDFKNKIDFSLKEVRNCRIDGKTIYITAGKEARFRISQTCNDEVLFELSSDLFEISRVSQGSNNWKFSSETSGVIIVKVDGVVIGEIIIVVE